MSKSTRQPGGSQVPADRIARDCLAVRMRLLNRTVTNIYDDALRPLDLKVSQLNILVVVAKRGPISPADVARVLHLEKSTLSRNVDRIQSRGWITVAAIEGSRKHALRLTARGRRLIDKALPLWEEAQQRAHSVLGQSGTEALRHAAGRVWSSDTVN